MTRVRLAVLFTIVLAAGLYFAGRAEQDDLDRYRAALNVARSLLNAPTELFPEAEQRQLQDILLQLQFATSYYSQGPLAQRDCAVAVERLSYLFERSSDVQRLSVPGAPAQLTVDANRVLLLRVGQNRPPGEIPRFTRAQFDLSRNTNASLELGTESPVYAAVFFTNAPAGAHQVPLRLLSSGKETGRVDLTVQAPPSGDLKVTFLDADTGKPTPAVAGVYAADNRLMTPAEALAFDEGGFYYTGGRVRPNVQVHYWPGTPQQHKVFFVGGSFSLRVPEGRYTLIGGKGMEYLPVTETVEVKAGATVSRQIRLKRWVDMRARGWVSGDGHVHYARSGEAANRRLLTWAQAEDVHMINVLRMGDASETYFEQYGFGQAGRVISGDYAIVPGQEDPRTNVMGHTLQLNLQKPARFPDRYYLYDLVFDEVHRQGGLTGYAHVQQPPAAGFLVRRDMTLNIPQHRVDFAEICEFGQVGEEVYYEFLNLGFPLTASAGSDVPWGNTIGTSRVYVYTGKAFSPDAWFAGLKAGHTFVTSGPMIEFTVNGELPGSEIHARRGDILHVKATAYGQTVPPGYLEIVAQGEVVKSAKQGSLSLDFTLPVRGSTWIAARCSGAHTTPVYVTVEGRRFWRVDQVPALIARRLEQLQEVDQLSTETIAASHQGNWDNPDALKKGAAELRERVASTRTIYQNLLRQAKQEQ